MGGLVHRHLFDSETGTRPVPAENILAIYDEHFVRFKHIRISTQSDERDVEGQVIDLTEEQLAQRREQAQDIFDRISESGNDVELFEQLLESDSDDIAAKVQLPMGFTVSSDMTFLPENMLTAAFDMQIGDVRLVETEMGFHIMKRYELMPPEETPDLTSSGNSIAATLMRDYQQYILRDELAPFIENIIIHREETDQFNIKSSDVMFDVWSWIGM
jgi:hypothetical protein